MKFSKCEVLTALFLVPRIIKSDLQTDTSSETRVIGVLELQNVNSTRSIGTIPIDRLKYNKNKMTRDPLYSLYPKCPDTCPDEWIGDGWCDTPCANEECGNDGEDCKDWCAPDCASQWLGDNHCDLNCFRPECNYDEGDCSDVLKKNEIRFPLPSHKDFDYSKCPNECVSSKLNNGVCDVECNRKECNFDGTDCVYQCSAECYKQWLGDDQCDEGCNNKACGFDKGDCKICSPGCEPGMVGNGVCDAACYNDDCYMDMGDCFGLCWYAEKMDYFSFPFFYPHCRNEWKGDGSCDCLCMTAECGYDYGDCENYNCTRDWKHVQDTYVKLNLTTEKIPHLHPYVMSPSSIRALKQLKIKTKDQPKLKSIKHP